MPIRDKQHQQEITSTIFPMKSSCSRSMYSIYNLLLLPHSGVGIPMHPAMCCSVVQLSRLTGWHWCCSWCLASAAASCWRYKVGAIGAHSLIALHAGFCFNVTYFCCNFQQFTVFYIFLHCSFSCSLVMQGVVAVIQH